MKVFVLLSLLAAQAHAGERTDASEAMVKAVCASSAPVLVLDNFAADGSWSAPVIDSNGDGYYDHFHGDFVAGLIEANGQKTIRVQVPSPVKLEKLLEILTRYVEEMEQGKLKVSWINLSQAQVADFESINALLGLRNKVKPANLHLYAEKIMEVLVATRPKQMYRELRELFLRLQRLGVPVFAAGANNGFSEVNIYSLFPNVYSVGSIDLEGKKASYSADNSLVTLWRLGHIKTFSSPGGIDFNGDDKADLALESPEIPVSLLRSLQGKISWEVARRIPKDIDDANDNNRTNFFELVEKLPEGLYSTYEVATKTLASDFQQVGYMKNLGAYFYKDARYRLPLVFFPVNGQGEIRIPEEKMRERSQLRNVIFGTSFASPNICNGALTPPEFSL